MSARPSRAARVGLLLPACPGLDAPPQLIADVSQSTTLDLRLGEDDSVHRSPAAHAPAKGFPEEALDTVPLDRASDAPTHRDAEPSLRVLVPSYGQDEETSLEPRSFAQDPPEMGPLPDALRARQAHGRVRPRSDGAPSGDAASERADPPWTETAPGTHGFASASGCWAERFSSCCWLSLVSLGGFDNAPSAKTRQSRWPGAWLSTLAIGQRWLMRGSCLRAGGCDKVRSVTEPSSETLHEPPAFPQLLKSL
jgi:hypothetical protein